MSETTRDVEGLIYPINRDHFGDEVINKADDALRADEGSGGKGNAVILPRAEYDRLRSERDEWIQKHALVVEKYNLACEEVEIQERRAEAAEAELERRDAALREMADVCDEAAEVALMNAGECEVGSVDERAYRAESLTWVNARNQIRALATGGDDE